MSPQGQSSRAGAIGPRPPRPSHRPPHNDGPVSLHRPSRPTPTGASGLRLVRPPEDDAAAPLRPAPRDDAAPIMDAADPRWVLAIRTSQCLQGAILAPEQRDRLLILARLLGLTPFDANLIIAIVQDQARRGHAKEYCAAAGRSQLAMIPLPAKARLKAAMQRRQPLRTAGLVAMFIALELALLAWWLWMR